MTTPSTLSLPPGPKDDSGKVDMTYLLDFECALRGFAMGGESRPIKDPAVRWPGCMLDPESQEIEVPVANSSDDIDLSTSLRKLIDHYYDELEMVCRISMFGAKKYVRGSWVRVPDAYLRYTAAAWRHDKKLRDGEAIDPESGFPHEASLCWNCIARCQLWANEHNRKIKLADLRAMRMSLERLRLVVRH